MSYQPNHPPMMENPYDLPPQGLLPVWSKVLTDPSERTFVKIIQHPQAKAKSAYVWVFITGTLSALITSLVLSVVMRQTSPESGQTMSQLLPKGGLMFITALGLLGTLCSAALGGLFSTIGFAIQAALVQAAASTLGGRGSFDRLAYTFGAITAPITLISTLIVPLNIIPSASYCAVPLLLALGLYMVILQVIAIKAVHRVGWGAAVGALILPGILMVILCCGLLVLFRLALPSIVPQGTPVF